MPELPEVETTLRGIAPHVEGQKIESCILRERRLRQLIPDAFESRIAGQRVSAVERRGKYLLFRTDCGHMLVHLGMSGSLRLVEKGVLPQKHDHVDWVLSSGKILRFRDPRRFGAVTWIDGDPACHPLLASLGPEPLTGDFSAHYLHDKAKGRKVPVKSFIMNSHVVVGVGNIYANEALFTSGIHPLRLAGQISLARYQRLVSSIKTVLAGAINQGGTTLRDFVGGNGQPGYFAQSLNVYGREGESCTACGSTLKGVRLSQRTTVYCPRCQR